MKTLIKKDELIEKIGLFNSMFIEDFESNNQKKWADYINPIVLKFFNMSYLDFIKMYNISNNSLPGSFEKYYNFFKISVDYFKSLTMLSIVNDIYICCDDILNTFNDFINMNNLKVKKVKNLDKETNLILNYYEIYPLV